MSDLIPWLAPWSGRVLTLGVLFVGLYFFVRFIRGKRFDYPHCPRCWYNLTGLDHLTCPECGHKAKHERELHARHRHEILAMFMLLVAFSLPSYIAYRRMSTHGSGYYFRLYPLYWFFPEAESHHYTLNDDYELTVLVDRRDYDKQAFTITYQGRAVQRITQWMHRDLMGPFGQVPFKLGDDVTGNGLPNLVLGGYPYQRDLTILEINAGQMYEVFQADCVDFHIADEDRDGIIEISCQFVMPTNRTFSTPTYHHRSKSIVCPVEITFLEGEPIMRKPFMSVFLGDPEYDKQHADKMRDDPYWFNNREPPNTIFQTAVSIAYIGEPKDAIAFLRYAWPESIADKCEPYIEQFKTDLRNAPYGDQLDIP